MSSRSLYHFTCTARLPFIIRSGELRPAIYPGERRDFLHATDNPNGERTASGFWTASGGSDPYRDGGLRRVRFTLSADGFEPWRTVCERFPGYTPEIIARLEQKGRERGGHPGRVSLIGWAGTATHPFDANSGRWQQGAETAASSH